MCGVTPAVQEPNEKRVTDTTEFSGFSIFVQPAYVLLSQEAAVSFADL